MKPYPSFPMVPFPTILNDPYRYLDFKVTYSTLNNSVQDRTILTMEDQQ